MRTKIGIICAAMLLLAGCGTVNRTVQVTNPGGQDAKHEFRGAWIQTVGQGEYKQMSVTEMKVSFIKKLDELHADGINAILFQIRPEADAFYQSNLEPWSRYFTGEQGKAPEGNFDPLAFMVTECHKRAMELHAWMNPYRARVAGQTQLAPSHIYYKHPEWFLTYNGQLLFNPSLPECRQFICDVVKDILTRYDVDAIHMDDYFYPYPHAGEAFPDQESFEKYGVPAGYTADNIGDWRRENVNKLIEQVKRTIVLTKPWVRFGVSPFGIYRNKKHDPNGSNTNGLENYDDLYADILLWVKKGWVDYDIPQLYWEIGHKAADYTTLINWWDANAYGRPLYIGQDVDRTMKAGQLTAKMQAERTLPHVSGNCYWPANELLWNNTGVRDSLRLNYNRYPALIPPYKHLCENTPKAVSSVKATWTEKGYLLNWKAKKDISNPEAPNYFVVYRFAKGAKMDLNDPSHIVTITPETSYLLPYEKGRESWKYVVTTVDRFNNESLKGKVKGVKL